jgi:hypothetical protein
VWRKPAGVVVDVAERGLGSRILTTILCRGADDATLGDLDGSAALATTCTWCVVSWFPVE